MSTEKLPRGITMVINRIGDGWTWHTTRGVGETCTSLALRAQHDASTRRAVGVWTTVDDVHWKFDQGWVWLPCEHGLPAEFPHKITNTELKEIISHEPT